MAKTPIMPPMLVGCMPVGLLVTRRHAFLLAGLQPSCAAPSREPLGAGKENRRRDSLKQQMGGF